MIQTHPRQADPTGNFVGDVLPVDVSHPGARDVLHPTTTHPHLQKERERLSSDKDDLGRGGLVKAALLVFV